MDKIIKQDGDKKIFITESGKEIPFNKAKEIKKPVKLVKEEEKED